MFFISGITGHVGGAAARQLLAAGYAVRTLARDPRKAIQWSNRGVEVLPGDFQDAAAVAHALHGVDGAFLMLPPFFTPAPGFPEAQAIVESYCQALAEAPPPRLVALSSVGSQQPHGLGMITATHLLEQGIADFPFPVAFLRAGSFLENYLPNLALADTTGYFDTYLAPIDRPIPMAATEDIGQEAALLLTTNWTGQKIIELGSLLSPQQVAAAMSEVLGRAVQARSIPRDQWTATLQSQGLPPAFAIPFIEMEDGFNSGWIAFGVPGTESVPSRTPPAQVFAHSRR